MPKRSLIQIQWFVNGGYGACIYPVCFSRDSCTVMGVIYTRYLENSVFLSSTLFDISAFSVCCTKPEKAREPGELHSGSLKEGMTFNWDVQLRFYFVMRR